MKSEKTFFKKFLAIFGMGYFVSVGYMDPGNWATDLRAGSSFGYKLIWVLVMANLIAIILQSLTIYLGIYSKCDLAEVSNKKYPLKLNYFLFILCEIAIIATDLAELLGSAVALKLLLNIPLLLGIIITVFDVFLLLLLEKKGFSLIHALIVILVLTIVGCFAIELIIVKPNIWEITKGLNPTIPNKDALFISIGMIGATIMPHNLYLQSGLVKKYEPQKKEQERVNNQIRDLICSLFVALLVNMSILILASTVFNKSGNKEIASIENAYQMLAPLVSQMFVPIIAAKASALIFGFALLLSGQASTITGTLSGEIVMKGFLNLNFSSTKIRLFTRIMAIIPAVVIIGIFGEKQVDNLLIASQVILSFQLPFAIIPLILAVKDKKLMNGYEINKILINLAIISGAVISTLNVLLIFQMLQSTFNNYLITFLGIGLVIYGILILNIKYQKE